jgi:hypothetical protein
MARPSLAVTTDIFGHFLVAHRCPTPLATVSDPTIVTDPLRAQGTDRACLGWPGMRVHHAKTDPRHDHAPDTDDVWAWIVIGLIAAGTVLAIWLPMLKVMLQAWSGGGRVSVHRFD